MLPGTIFGGVIASLVLVASYFLTELVHYEILKLFTPSNRSRRMNKIECMLVVGGVLMALLALDGCILRGEVRLTAAEQNESAATLEGTAGKTLGGLSFHFFVAAGPTDSTTGRQSLKESLGDARNRFQNLSASLVGYRSLRKSANP